MELSILVLFAFLTNLLVVWNIVSSLLITEVGNILLVKEGSMIKTQQLNVVGEYLLTSSYVKI